MENTLLHASTAHDFGTCKDDDQLIIPQNSLANLINHSLLVGAEKLLMSRKSPALLTTSTFLHHNDNDDNKTQIMTSSNIGNIASQHGRYETNYPNIEPSNPYYRHFDGDQFESANDDDYISTLANFPYRFPLDVIDFLAMMVLKFVGFQVSLFSGFLIFPIRVFNFWLALFMFPFRTLAKIRENIRKQLLRACTASYSRLISFIWNRLNSPKSVMKIAIRFSKGFFCSFYVFLVLVSLLVSAFVISGLVMRNLTQEPIVRTENLNFDYTKTSPFALVKLASSPEESLLKRSIPLDHKMQLTISLTLPESDYNRKLGVFQVRVESLSANGKVTYGSSYPTMLRFKSQPIRFAESLFKSVPLITGFQSEVQYLKVVIGEFSEGYEPTASFKVILEQRAEFKAGSGVPEIYSASMDIASRLPPLKRIVWSWRRTVFVWIGLTFFAGEMMFVLRPVVLPGLGKSSTKKMN